MINKVQFTPGFEAFSGQVVKMKGKLTYEKNNNPAWQAPVGKQYATNFRPRLVLNVRKSDGSVYWGIRTKSAVDNTEAGRLRFALFGGAQACVTAATHNPTLLSNLYDAYKTVEDQYKSFRSWLTIWMRLGLKNKSATITIGQGVNIKNPWVAGGTGTELTISDEVLVKFAPYLCPNTEDILRLVTGAKITIIGVPSSSMTWGAFVASKFNNGDFSLGNDNEVLYKGAGVYQANSPSEEEVAIIDKDDVVVITQTGYNYYMY